MNTTNINKHIPNDHMDNHGDEFFTMDHNKPVPTRDEIDFIIYHRSCPDGWGAFMVCYRYLRSLKNDAHIRLKSYAMSHKDKKIPDVKGANLLIVDFSMKRDVYCKLYNEAKKIIFLDHHKGSDILMDLPNVFIDKTISGVILSWKFFHGDDEPPKPYLYIQDRDLWVWKMEKSRQVSISVYLRLSIKETDDNIKAWDNYIDDPLVLERFQHDGEYFLEFQQLVVKQAADYAKVYDFFGYKTAFCEATNFHSEIGERLLQTGKCQVAMIWTLEEYNRVYSIKLRSLERGDESIDVDILAKKFGGGGHVNAAAFSFPATEVVHKVFERAKQIYDTELVLKQMSLEDLGIQDEKKDEPTATLVNQVSENQEKKQEKTKDTNESQKGMLIHVTGC